MHTSLLVALVAALSSAQPAGAPLESGGVAASEPSPLTHSGASPPLAAPAAETPSADTSAPESSPGTETAATPPASGDGPGPAPGDAVTSAPAAPAPGTAEEAPSGTAPTAAPAPAAAAPKPVTQKPLRLAAPGLNAVNVDVRVATFVSEHFAQELAAAGVAVVTAGEIASLIGLERQKQLLGCEDDSSSCVVELANALGVDGLVTGSVGRFGATYRANLKVLSSRDGEALAIITRKASSESELLDELSTAARESAPGLFARTGRTPMKVFAQEQKDKQRQLPANVITLTPFPLVFVPGVIVLGAEYERAVHDHFTVHAGIEMASYSLSFPAANPLKYDATGSRLTYRTRQAGGTMAALGLGARLYLSGRAPDGLFLGLDVQLGTESITRVFTVDGVEGPPSNAIAAGLRVRPGAMIGYTGVILKHLVISAGLGMGYSAGVALMAETVENNRFWPITRLNAGVAF